MKSLTRRITGENKRKIREVEKLGAMAPMSFALLNFAYLLGPPHHQYHKDQRENFEDGFEVSADCDRNN